MTLARDCEGNHSSTMSAASDQAALSGSEPRGPSFLGKAEPAG